MSARGWLNVAYFIGLALVIISLVAGAMNAVKRIEPLTRQEEHYEQEK